MKKKNDPYTELLHFDWKQFEQEQQKPEELEDLWLENWMDVERKEKERLYPNHTNAIIRILVLCVLSLASHLWICSESDNLSAYYDRFPCDSRDLRFPKNGSCLPRLSCFHSYGIALFIFCCCKCRVCDWCGLDALNAFVNLTKANPPSDDGLLVTGRNALRGVMGNYIKIVCSTKKGEIYVNHHLHFQSYPL